jgi:hypothetical protein
VPSGILQYKYRDVTPTELLSRKASLQPIPAEVAHCYRDCRVKYDQEIW